MQGNLDPTLLLGPADRAVRRGGRRPAAAAGRAGHVFNLGHGVLPSTPLERVQELARYVHRTSARPIDAGAPLGR